MKQRGSGVLGGGNWGPRGREVGEKGEGSGDWVPPCPPLQYDANEIIWISAEITILQAKFCHFSFIYWEHLCHQWRLLKY